MVDNEASHEERRFSRIYGILLRVLYLLAKREHLVVSKGSFGLK